MPKNPEITVTAVSDVVGANIRDLRRHRDQTVDQLAQAAAVAGHPELTRAAIYAVESGRRRQGRRQRTVSVDELLAFAEVFGVPVFELLPAAAPSFLELAKARRDAERMLFETLPALERYKDELRGAAERQKET